MEIKYFDENTGYDSKFPKNKIADFLQNHLDEYGDAVEHIEKCMDYSMSEKDGKGGFILIAVAEDDIKGAVIVNKTGMSGYIPENILVYIATHRLWRGKGVGKALIEETLKKCSGDIALHVEKHNPARFLYEKYGFTNPYLEMRLKRKK